MSVYEAFQRILPRFCVNHPNTPATTFVFGIVVPQQRPFSVIISRESALIKEDVKQAEYILYGDGAIFEALLDPATIQRRALVEKLDLRPNYPFDQYLISILLKAFQLDVSDLNYEPRRFDDFFPFPPRYPVAENTFRQMHYIPTDIPAYSAKNLPELIADAHPQWVSLYHTAWQIGMKNLRQPEPESGFIANFIDTAFNANTFLWDSCFMTMFGHLGRRTFDFMGTLNNFYAKQHDDGFICREINTYTGTDLFQSLDPRSTGPNILAWAEWQAYQHTRNINRLHDIFPVIIAYHRWWQDWRTHPDGGYWTSGWGSGMDNQTRVPQSEYHHRHFTWIDAMMQQALSCQMLIKIAHEINRDEFNEELTHEFEGIQAYINTKMWDEERGFYYDRSPDGTLSQIKTIGAYWGLLSDVVPSERAERLIAHLQDEKGFNRPHPIPTQAYDSPDYNPYGGYWLGGVWSPTNYMVLCGLTRRGYHTLAHQIAHKHVEQVAKIYVDSGTLYENYSPEYAQAGIPARKDFVGWTGVSAITIPLDYLVGISIHPQAHSLSWDIRLTERHGVMRYPVGKSNVVDLICEAYQATSPIREIIITTQEPITLYFHVGATHKIRSFERGKHHIILDFSESDHS
ncbi:MAG: trehalase family glycosidase [bacterium]|nr:trehalase family glycosidase [bacterium]